MRRLLREQSQTMGQQMRVGLVPGLYIVCDASPASRRSSTHWATTTISTSSTTSSFTYFTSSTTRTTTSSTAASATATLHDVVCDEYKDVGD